jgi:hypothetical protein
MKAERSSIDYKAAARTALPNSLIETFLELDSALRVSSINLIDVLTDRSPAQRADIPVDETRHFPDDDVFDPGTGAQYFLHRHAARHIPASVHIHFFQRWTPSELQLQGPETITTHLAALELNALGEPQAWFAVNQWVVGDYWQPADDTIRLFSDWKITTPDEGRGKNIQAICHQWLAAYLKLNLSATISPLLQERDALLDRLVDSNPDVNVLEDKSHEILSYQGIDFNAQLDAWKRALQVSVALL